MPRIPVTLVIVLILTPVLITHSGVEASGEREWTLMFYMGGKGDLSDMIEGDIEDLRKVHMGGEVSVVVLADEKGYGDSRLVEIADGKINHIPLDSVNSSWVHEVDMSDGNTLGDFVRWTTANFPSRRYFLNLWGHGNGWLGMSMEEDGSLLTLPEMKAALEGLHLDIIGFDSCTMGMFEVYYQLADHCGIMIASEKEEPISGWPYTDIMNSLKEEPGMEASDFATAIVNRFVDWGANHSAVSTTLTAVDASRLPVEEFEHYTSELSLVLPLYHQEVHDAWEGTEGYQPFPNPKDLYHFTMNVHHRIDSHRLGRAGIMLREALNSSLIAHRVHSLERDPARNAHGIGIYFPTHGIHHGYGDLEFSRLGWSPWLERFIRPPDIIPDPYLDLELIHGEGLLETRVSHALHGASVEIDFIPRDGPYRREFSLKNRTTFIYHGLGDHRVEVSLIYEGGLAAHLHEYIELNRTFVVRGVMDSPHDVTLSVMNPRTSRAKNFTFSPGNYSVSLNVPYFCAQGDPLLLRYTSGDLEVKREIVVSSGGGEVVDVSIYPEPVSLRWLVLSLQILLVVLIIVLYIRGSRGFLR